MRYPTIGDRIRATRAQNGFSQTRFALRIGIARPTLANYELNRRPPTLEAFMAMANALNCSLDWLAGLED